MKSRMVTRRAGRADARYTHQGFPPKGGTNHALLGLVGWGDRRTDGRSVHSAHTQLQRDVHVFQRESKLGNESTKDCSIFLLVGLPTQMTSVAQDLFL
jgi:hypothetical protein